MIGNNRGWVTFQFAVLSSFLISLIGLVFFFQLNLNQEMSSDKICRIEQREIMNSTRDKIHTLFRYNELAQFLHDFQEALTPLIWIPHVFQTYQTIEKLRRSFDLIQRTYLSISNVELFTMSYKLYQKLKDSYAVSARAASSYYHLNSIVFPATFFTLAVERKFNYLFPPYKFKRQFTRHQALEIKMINRQKHIGLLDKIVPMQNQQFKSCKASLEENDKMTIVYYAKNALPKAW